MRVVDPNEILNDHKNIVDQFKKERKEQKEKSVAEQLKEKADAFNYHKYDKRIAYLVTEITAGSTAIACQGQYVFTYYHKDFQVAEIAEKITEIFSQQGFKVAIKNDDSYANHSQQPQFFIQLNW